MPFFDKRAQNYFQAANQAANYAFANRQILDFKALEIIFACIKKPINYTLIYVVHNIAKIEEHSMKGKVQKLIVHRKAATRAFYAKHPYLRNSRYFEALIQLLCLVQWAAILIFWLPKTQIKRSIAFATVPEELWVEGKP